MKISKLFHWLYAILMLLPVVVFIPTAFYYGFNEHAVAQEKTEHIVEYYDSNVISFQNQFVEGNVYSWINSFSGASVENDINLFDIVVMNGDLINQSGRVYINHNNGMVYFAPYGNIRYLNFDFLVTNIYDSILNAPLSAITRFTYCSNQYIKNEYDDVYSMSITDSMSYAWNSTWQNVLFSWSYDSFLTQPFLYITNLFNVPPTNTLLYCLSYWLNISIIWLVFDVVLYVPLLVHRWIDKGIVE